MHREAEHLTSGKKDGQQPSMLVATLGTSLELMAARHVVGCADRTRSIDQNDRFLLSAEGVADPPIWPDSESDLTECGDHQAEAVDLVRPVV